MPVEFDWHVQDEEQHSAIASTRRRRLPRWVWMSAKILVATTLALAAVAYGILRFRYDRARRQALFHIQDVIALEAASFAQGDRDRFLEHQDRASPRWFRTQALRINPDCKQIAPSADRCLPVLPAEIEDLELLGDTAWVEVLEGDPPLRRARFYRSTTGGWVHTAARTAFWREPVEVRREVVIVRYHERDHPYIDSLLEQIDAISRDVSHVTRHWSAINKLRIEIHTDSSAPFSPHLERGVAAKGAITLRLASPWLSGIPVDGQWGEAYVEDLTYWVAYGALASSLQDTTEDGQLNALQRAMVAEYATWYASGDTTQAPILGRIIDQHGAGALTRVFLSLRRSHLLSLFLVRWLSLHPRDLGFFEALLNIECDAIATGQKETFLLLQSQSWIEEQARYYDRARVNDPYASLVPVQVRSLELADDRARVRIADPPHPLPGLTPQTLDSYAFFRQENADWKHATSADGSLWPSVPDETSTPTPLTTPDRAP
jgi:hypothetical protein